MNFLVSIPAWGNRSPEMLIATSLRSLLAGLVGCPVEGSIRFLVHTDRSDFLKPAFRGLDVEFRRVATGVDPHTILGHAHRDALNSARSGECVILLCADQVLSRETLAFCEKSIKGGKKAIFCAGPRTLSDPALAPIGASGRSVARWSLDHPHQWLSECYWGKGKSFVLSTLYFSTPSSTVTRAFHLHPIAVLKDRDLTFSRVTIDDDLIYRFSKDEIHVVQTPDEFAVAEISPEDKTSIARGSLITVDAVVGWARNHATEMHRWLFGHRIILAGDGENCGDDLVVGTILTRLAALDAQAAPKEMVA